MITTTLLTSPINPVFKTTMFQKMVLFPLYGKQKHTLLGSKAEELCLFCSQFSTEVKH